MTYRVPLPAGGRRATLDILEPNTTAVQRSIRREGLGAYEPSTAAAMLALCERCDPGFVVFDVGANMGLYGEFAAAMFSPSMVHAFEPTPASAAVAERIGRRNGLALTVHEVAVSDRVGSAELYLSPVSDASNSLVEGFRQTDQRVAVDTVTVDDVVERTGAHPDIIKIDVETHERAVLDGARGTIERDRPALIIEVLRRKGRDHGEEISEFFAGLGYSGFELAAEPTWVGHTVVRGSGTVDRDWLMLPDELPGDFPERWSVWRDRLAACTADRNPRVPIRSSVGAAFRRGGWREVVATAERYRQSRRRS